MAKTLLGFCLVYLPHYFSLPKADFHPDLFQLLGDWSKQFIEVAGFRGSAKSTIAGVALSLFAGLEEKSKFIIPINETDEVVKLTIANIREELEHNEMIILDYGNLIENKERSTKFTETNILLANGCRIFGRSRGQKIRGLRHRQYRPDLVIVDDPEELEKVDKKVYRDKTERWLRSVVIPAIEELKARLIVIENILHSDSLAARLAQDDLFVHRRYALMDENNNILWKAKYPNQAAIELLKKKVGRTAFLREYMLKVVPPEGQEIKEEWIQYYDSEPALETIMRSGVGTDLAISKKETADYTAMVKGYAAEKPDDRPRIYILPWPINERFSFHETIQQAKSLYMSMKKYTPPDFFVEDVGYQRAAIEELKRAMLPVTAMRPGTDKRARLRSISGYI